MPLISMEDAVKYQNRNSRSDAWMAGKLGMDRVKYNRLKNKAQLANEDDLKNIDAFLSKERFNTNNDKVITSTKDSILQISASANNSIALIINQFTYLSEDDGYFSIPDAMALIEIAKEEKAKTDKAFDDLIYALEHQGKI